MRKFKILILSLLSIFTLYGCKDTNDNLLRGFYQSEITTDGHIVQVSVQPQENSFVEYIDNREVNSGTYEKLSTDKYKLVGDKRTIEIVLDKNNSFEILIKKINKGNSIKMKNIGATPGYFATEFDDVEEYKKLLED